MEYLNLIHFIENEVMQHLSPLKKLCFFPGTFNPWHKGHQACINLHIQNFSDIPVIILPDYNPRKHSYLNTQSYENLFNYLLKEHLLHPHFQCYLSDTLLATQKQNSTFTWIRTLKKYFSHLDLGLIMGMDCFLQIDTWHQSASLLNDLSFIEVVPREIDSQIRSTSDQLTHCKSVNNALSIHILPSHPFLTLKSSTQRT